MAYTKKADIDILGYADYGVNDDVSNLDLNDMLAAFEALADNVVAVIGSDDTPNITLNQAGYPVGSFYTQYPDANSNTTATAFPTTRYPAAIFGGTWTAQWNTEATYFRTQGDPHASETETASRTNGSQPDQIQGHEHRFSYDTSYGAAGAAGNFLASGSWYNTEGMVANATHGAPRTGYTTQAKNRLFIVWKRTA